MPSFSAIRSWVNPFVSRINLIYLIVAKFRRFRILTLFLFKGIAEEEALKIGMDEKSQEFLQDGAAIYHEV